MNLPIQLKTALLPLFIGLVLAWFGLAPASRAVSPAPDGEYPGGNTAEGFQALVNNKAGPQNTATGRAALFSNTNGHDNTANGFSALHSNTTGDNNTAIGDSALLKNTTGNANTALGHGAGSNLTTGNNNIDIGNLGLAGESRTIRIGDSNHTRTFLAGISGAAVMGATVHVNAAGQLGTSPSSA